VKKLALLLLSAAMVLVGLVAPASTTAATGGRPGASDPVPLPDEGALFGAFVKLDEHNGLERRQAMLGFEALAERKMAIDRQYYLWDEPFPTADDEWSRDQGRTLYISWNGNASTPQQGCANWADIAAGAYDAELDARADAIKAFGAPLFFTFHHEPMTAPPPGYESCGTNDEFIAAWRYIHDRFAAQGVNNVSWSWTVTAWSFDQFEAENWYPGDDVVDVVAADGYNWFGCEHHPGPWREFDQIFQRFYEFGVDHGKPMVVAEYGTGEDDEVEGKKAQWFTNAGEILKGWPEIKGVSYFNVGSSCARYIDSSESSRAAFAALGADPYFNPEVAATPVEVSDFQFDPRVARIDQGTSVEWSFTGPSTHTATDSSGMDLFDSGPQAPGGTYDFEFIAAGKYRYECSIHPTQMQGSVRVPVEVSPDTGEIGDEFTVTWASQTAPTDYVYDVQIKRPGDPGWSYWITGKSPSTTFVPDAGEGRYNFQARLRNTANGGTSLYSAPVSILVTPPAPPTEHNGDFNGDGWPDLVVSASEDDAREVVDGGTVNVLYGSPSGIQADDPDDLFLTQDHPGVPGEARNKDEFGRTLATGDFDGNGFDDLAVGAIFEDVGDPPNVANDAGGFNTFYGSADGLTTVGAQFIVQNDIGGISETGDLFGGALHSADFNGDGYDDLAVGAWHETLGDEQFAGAVHIMFGSAAGLSLNGTQYWTQDSPDIKDQAEAFDEFGRQLADADFNQDGYRDLAIGVRLESVGTEAEAGAVNVLYGSATGLTALYNQFFTQDSPGMAGDGAEEGDWFGRPVTPGDFNADGYDDLLVGSRTEDVGTVVDAGAAHVLYGGPGGLTTNKSQYFTQDTPGIEEDPEVEDWFGHQAAAGDYNGDGFDDVTIGPFGESVGAVEKAGAVHVLFGSPAGLTATGSQYWTQDSPGVQEDAEAGDWFSFYMWSKDFDQDGYDDVVIAANADSVGDVEEAGLVIIMFGSADGLTADGNQLWSQNSPGVTGDGAEFHDLFGGIIT
jgi:plastocyanin